MKKRMEHLLAGEFEYEAPALIFSKEKIQVTLRAGETERGEVYFGTEEDLPIRGYITSSSRRLVPGMEEFSGTTICLPYGIDAVGLTPGESCKEYLTFITNIGEYRLNFEIHAEDEEVRTRQGNISTLEEFRDLARDNFREAFRLFCDKSFPAILAGASPKEKSLYAGLTTQPITYQHLEEYLIASGLKEKVTIELPVDREDIFDVQENESRTFEINKSGWGHLRLDVEVEGGFLEVEKHVLTDEDFIGRRYNLVYIIKEEELSDGIRYGCIRLKSPYQVLEYEIAASLNSHITGGLRLKEKRSRLILERDFLDYLDGKLDVSAWAMAAHYVLSELKAAGFDDSGYRMYEAYVLLKEAKAEEAKEVLRSFQNKAFSRDDLELAGLYLYLCTESGLYHDREAALARIQNFYMQKSDSMLLFFLQLEMDSSYQESPTKALFDMEELFGRGCKHPVLYAMAWKIVTKEESLFHKLGSFWTQVLLYAGRRGLLTEEMVMRTSHLAGYEKEFHESLYRVLSYGCEAYPNAENVEAMCRYLMLGNPRRPEYFRWYQKAVELGVRLTRLYEYYMETVDLTYHQPLPKSLLLYFTYNTKSLGDARKAYLYASVISDKEKNPEIYESYKERIRKFAEQKIREGRTGEDYSVIYQEFLGKPTTPEAAEAIAGQIFACRLYCDNPKIHSVIVRHSQLAKEEIFPFVQGVAYPRIYTEDAAILFLDGNKRRYGVTINYSLQRMMEGRDMVPEILEKGVLDPGTLLHFAETREIDSRNLDLFQKLVQSDAFTLAYRQEIRKRILDYYTAQAYSEDLDAHLKNLDYREYAKVDKVALMEILVNRGLYRETYELLEEFGCEGLSNSSLLRLVNFMIREKEGKREDEVLALAYEVYKRGVYNENLLSYLMEYRVGPLEDLFRMEKSAEGFDLETRELEQRILELLMFTQDYRKDGERVLAKYYAHSGSKEIIGAYLCQIAYGTFVREYPMSPEILRFMELVYEEKWPVDQICHLALFKELCKDKTAIQERQPLLTELLEECVSAGYTFSFFRRLPAEMLTPYQLDDKMYVEVHTNPEARVTLHYRLDNGLPQKDAYKTVPLDNMYEGIFGKTFTLFYDENLSYWFEIETGRETKKTAERVVTMNRVEGAPVSKYQQINQMLSARKLQKKQQEAYERLRQYLRQQQYVSELFVINREG